MAGAKETKRDGNGRIVPKGSRPSLDSLVVEPRGKPAEKKPVGPTSTAKPSGTPTGTPSKKDASDEAVTYSAPASYYGEDGQLLLPNEDWSKTKWKGSRTERVTGDILSPSFYQKRLELLKQDRLPVYAQMYGSSPAERIRAGQAAETSARKIAHAERLEAEKARNDAYYEKWKADNAARRANKLAASKDKASEVRTRKVEAAVETPLNRSSDNPRVVSKESMAVAEKVLPKEPGETPAQRRNSEIALGLLIDGNADKVPGGGQPTTYGEAMVEGATGGKPLPEDATDQDKLEAYGESVLPIVRLAPAPATPAPATPAPATPAPDTSNSGAFRQGGFSYSMGSNGKPVVTPGAGVPSSSMFRDVSPNAFSNLHLDAKGGHASLGSDGRYHRFSLLQADVNGGSSALYNDDRTLTATGQKVYDETLKEAQRSAGSGRPRIWINGREQNPQERAYKADAEHRITSSKSSPGTEYHFTDEQEQRTGVRLKGADSWKVAPGTYVVDGSPRSKGQGTTGTYNYSDKSRERFGKEGYGGIDTNGDAKKQFLDVEGWRNRWDRLNAAAKEKGGVLEGSLTEPVRYRPTWDNEKGRRQIIDSAMTDLFGKDYAKDAMDQAVGTRDAASDRLAVLRREYSSRAGERYARMMDDFSRSIPGKQVEWSAPYRSNKRFHEDYFRTLRTIYGDGSPEADAFDGHPHSIDWKPDGRVPDKVLRHRRMGLGSIPESRYSYYSRLYGKGSPEANNQRLYEIGARPYSSRDTVHRTRGY